MKAVFFCSLLERMVNLWLKAVEEVLLFLIYYWDFTHLYQTKDDEIIIATGLLDRNEFLLEEISLASGIIDRNFSSTTTDVRSFVIDWLHWHTTELQLVRWDLRILTHSTSENWNVTFLNGNLGWQNCWNGEERAVAFALRALDHCDVRIAKLLGNESKAKLLSDKMSDDSSTDELYSVS